MPHGAREDVTLRKNMLPAAMWHQGVRDATQLDMLVSYVPLAISRRKFVGHRERCVDIDGGVLNDTPTTSSELQPTATIWPWYSLGPGKKLVNLDY